MYGEWIRSGLEKPGKDVVGLALAITKALKLKRRMHRQTIYKMMKGRRNVKSVELAPISAYIEEPIPNIPSTNSNRRHSGMVVMSIPIKCEVGAGIWIEPGVSSTGPIGTIPVPKDEMFPNSTATAYMFRGDSMLGIGIVDGDIIICIPPHDDVINDGKLVVIERNRMGLIELSARIVRIFKDRTEYVVAGPNDSRYKPCIVHNKGSKRVSSENETVKVVAIIRRVTTNIP